ncbi:hypothetical protein HFN45_32470 [Rhizobium leguminosarum]|nr:hypothetical protein [Rhizobium leguminosarum]
MTDLMEMSQKATDQIIDEDLDRLFENLGKSMRVMSLAPETAGQFEVNLNTNVETLGPLDGLRDFGRSYFTKVEAQIHHLICSADDEHDRDKLAEAFGLGREAVAAALAGLLVSSLGIAPLIAVALAPIVIKIFFESAQQAMCEQWEIRLKAMKV